MGSCLRGWRDRSKGHLLNFLEYNVVCGCCLHILWQSIWSHCNCLVTATSVHLIASFGNNSGSYPCAVIPKKVMKYHVKQNIPWPNPKRGKAIGDEEIFTQESPLCKAWEKKRKTADIVNDEGSLFTRSSPSVAIVLSSGCSKRRYSQTCPTQRVQNVAMEL